MEKMNIKAMKSKKRSGIFILIIIFLLLVKFVLAPPSPHNIEGRVFTDNTKTEGVPAGMIVRINDTVTNDTVFAFTEDPGPPPLRGIYSATVSGNDNDLVIVSSWNATHFGQSNATLSATTTTIDVVFNRTRSSEANVTIILPANNSIKNNTAAFNVTANVSILGNDGTGCNATISFSNSAANITPDQNFTNQLGDVAKNDFRLTTWNVTGIYRSDLNITVTGQCNSDGIILEFVKSYTINVSILDTKPPRWQNPEKNDSSIEEHDFVRFNATWLDNESLSAFIFSINSSGFWRNISNFSFYGAYNISNFTYQINSSPGTVVGWAFYANDSYNSFNVTDIQTFTIISQYHLFYGYINSEIILGTSENFSIMSWLNDTDVQGNVYVSDEDTLNGVSWASLLPIGKDSSLNTVMNDWNDIDSILGLSNYSDSINKTFLSDNSPRNKTNFMVVGSELENVSVVNSTNASTFLTGILWDSSDSLDSQFDSGEREDIVFVTKISARSPGSYGIYDYEIKVPARLQAYRTPNNFDSLSFYVEVI